MHKCLVFFLLLTSCHCEKKATQFCGSAMTIPYCIQLSDPLSEEQENEIERLILQTFSEVHRLYNNWNPDSEISKLNALEAEKKAPLSPALTEFLTLTQQMVLLTEGKFDPTIGSLQKLWQRALQEEKLPEAHALALCFESTGWKKIHFDEGIFWKEHSYTALDLGGIAKGYTVDLLVKCLKDAGFYNFYVEWGGEIFVSGHRPDHQPWKIGIAGLHDLYLTNTAIATSGDYFQKWVMNEKTYTHIFDPYTKLPLESGEIHSVTVQANSCTEADAIATALMLFPTKQAAYAWARDKGYRVWIW